MVAVEGQGPPPRIISSFGQVKMDTSTVNHFLVISLNGLLARATFGKK